MAVHDQIWALRRIFAVAVAVSVGVGVCVGVAICCTAGERLASFFTNRFKKPACCRFRDRFLRGRVQIDRIRRKWRRLDRGWIRIRLRIGNVRNRFQSMRGRRRRRVEPDHYSFIKLLSKSLKHSQKQLLKLLLDVSYGWNCFKIGKAPDSYYFYSSC